MLNNLKGLLVAVTKFAVVSTTGVFGLGITLLVTFQARYHAHLMRDYLKLHNCR